MALVELSWVALAWPYLNEHYDIFDPDPASSAAPAGYTPGSGLPGLALVADAARAQEDLLAGLGLAGLVRRLRARRWDLAIASLVAAPLLILGLNSYGGEGRYRFYLFGLPWLCFFAAVACAPSASYRLRSAFREWRLALATAALGVCMLFAYFGLELANRVSRDDVDAAAWFERHAPRDSLLVGLTPTFPRRLSARYGDVYIPSHPGAPALIDHAAFRRRRLTLGELPAIERTVGAYGVPHTYLMLTPAQEHVGRLYGLLRAGELASLARVLRASRSFRVVYDRGAATVFKYRPEAKETRR
jgi:hypothetical protein